MSGQGGIVDAEPEVDLRLNPERAAAVLAEQFANERLERDRLSTELAEVKADRDRWVSRLRDLEERIRVGCAVLGGKQITFEPPTAPTTNADMQGPPRSSHGNRVAVAAFSAYMLDRLDANNHKGHWSAVPWQHLLRRLRHELEQELVAELEKPAGERSVTRVLHEAADVANFALMIGHNAAAGLLWREDEHVSAR